MRPHQLGKIALLHLGLLSLTGCWSDTSNERTLSISPKVTQNHQKNWREALPENGFQMGNEAFIRIFKEERELELWLKRDRKFALFRTYPIAGMSGQLGPKLAEGDRQAPEGFYFVKKEALNPNSRYHLSFNVGYPNKYDRAHDRTGSFIMVHGSNVSVGCFAMTDEKIEEIYRICEAALNNGQPFFRVHIFPFKMSDERLARENNHRWLPFWKNLQEGYELFEKTGTPPNVQVENKRYVFRD